MSKKHTITTFFQHHLRDSISRHRSAFKFFFIQCDDFITGFFKTFNSFTFRKSRTRQEFPKFTQFYFHRSTTFITYFITITENYNIFFFYTFFLILNLIYQRMKKCIYHWFPFIFTFCDFI